MKRKGFWPDDPLDPVDSRCRSSMPGRGYPIQVSAPPMLTAPPVAPLSLQSEGRHHAVCCLVANCLACHGQMSGKGGTSRAVNYIGQSGARVDVPNRVQHTSSLFGQKPGEVGHWFVINARTAAQRRADGAGYPSAHGPWRATSQPLPSAVGAAVSQGPPPAPPDNAQSEGRGDVGRSRRGSSVATIGPALQVAQVARSTLSSSRLRG